MCTSLYTIRKHSLGGGYNVCEVIRWKRVTLLAVHNALAYEDFSSYKF